MICITTCPVSSQVNADPVKIVTDLCVAVV